jgi:hypothetical protein
MNIFYVRIVPQNKLYFIKDHPQVQASAADSGKSYKIYCDDAYLPKTVVGKIEKVIRKRTTTTISGYACSFTHSSSIKVKVYAYGATIYRRGRRNSRANKKKYTLLAEGNSNHVSGPAEAVNCGHLSKTGRRFSITIPNSKLRNMYGHKFYVKGIAPSSSGQTDKFLQNSGRYWVR